MLEALYGSYVARQWYSSPAAANVVSGVTKATVHKDQYKRTNMIAYAELVAVNNIIASEKRT